MPSQIEVARQVYAAMQHRDFKTVLSLLDPDVALVVGPGVSPETGTFPGRDAVGGWFGRWFGAFRPDYRLEIEDMRDLGDRVAVVQLHTGQGRTSGAPVTMRNGTLIYFLAGRITRIEIFADPRQALDAGES
ncbi:MAG TPA: nuclear transport factor 2 family protein [Thermoleophilaceae bacterium]|nr:nuclear transport factor 2 family protein [Thermoleophilaceae bacterium]